MSLRQLEFTFPEFPQPVAESHFNIFHRCLQEISYLTSPAALNPLPSKLPLTLSIPTATEVEFEAQDNNPVLDAPPRPKKALPEEDLPSALPSKDGPKAEESSVGPVDGESKKETVNGTSAAPKAMESNSNPGPSQDNQVPQPTKTVQDDEDRIQTAIFRPESKEAWKEALRAAGEKAEQVSCNDLRGISLPIRVL